MKQVEVAVAVVFSRQQDRVLICRRKHDTVLGGYWEFPGGKRQDGETLEACALREVREEVGLTIEAVAPLAPLEHVYPHAAVRLYPFVCRHVAGEVQLLHVQDARWLTPQEITAYRFPEANAELTALVAQGWEPVMKAARGHAAPS